MPTVFGLEQHSKLQRFEYLQLQWHISGQLKHHGTLELDVSCDSTGLNSTFRNSVQRDNDPDDNCVTTLPHMTGP